MTASSDEPTDVDVQLSTKQLAAELGVPDELVRRHARGLGGKKNQRGHWMFSKRKALERAPAILGRSQAYRAARRRSDPLKPAVKALSNAKPTTGCGVLGCGTALVVAILLLIAAGNGIYHEITKPDPPIAVNNSAQPYTYTGSGRGAAPLGPGNGPGGGGANLALPGHDPAVTVVAPPPVLTTITTYSPAPTTTMPATTPAPKTFAGCTQAKGSCASSRAVRAHVTVVLLPNRGATPGRRRVQLTKATLCASDYRAPADLVPAAVRRKVFATYGIPSSRHAAYQLDEVIPLSLGGDLSSNNVWPQPWAGVGAAKKDRLEVRLRQLVCSDRMSLLLAQRDISRDWWKTYLRYAAPARICSTVARARLWDQC